MLNMIGSKMSLRKRGPAAIIPQLLLILALVLTMMIPSYNGSTKVYAAAPTVPAGWTNVFTDDFSGAANTGLNTTNWLYDIGHSYPGGPYGFGTGEIEAVTNSTANVYQDGKGNLVIKAIRDGAGNWTSGRVETNRTDFQAPVGGTLHVEASIQLPNLTGAAAAGYWPAFWMLGAPFRGNYWNWPGIGEMDIMENVQGINEVWGTVHCGTSPGGPCNEKSGIGGNRSGFSPSLQSAFHKYAIEWDRSVSPNQLRWYIDGNQYHQVSENQVDAGTWANAFNHGFFIILNNAIGGEFPAALGGGPTGATASGGALVIDYVSVWSKAGGGCGSACGGTPAAIPGQIEAENYSAMSGVQSEPTTDTGGGMDVGFIETNDWMDYNVNVATAGTYTVQYRVAAQSAPGSIQLQKGGATLATTTVPVTGGWQNWTTVTSTVNLTAGAQTLRLFAGTGGFNVNWINFVGSSTATPTPTPSSTPSPTSTPTPTSTPPPSGDFTQGVTSLSSTQAKIWFKPTTASALVDVHYLINGANQQNFRMTNNAGTWEQTVSSLTTGTKIEYWFTYEKGGPLFDTVHYTYTHGATATPTPTPTATPTPVTSNLLYVRDGASNTVQATLATTAGPNANTDTIVATGGVNHDGTPTNADVYVISGINGTYDSTKATAFNLYLDSGASAANGPQARISYDFNGDGVYDRVETYNYFATNNVANWELYTQAKGLKSATGTFTNMTNGKVKLEIWSAIGSGTSTIRTDATAANGSQSTITIPFK